MRALLLAAALAAAASAKKYNTTSRRIPGVLNVHIVPHTHDDVGWLKTVDQYYYGNRNDIQRAEVQNIISSVMKELAWNPDRKFVYVEQAFFQRWWSNQDDKMQALVQQLVSSGQFSFINGGWCMHDEANPSFVDMIDQTALGHRLLLQEFNVTPTVTWQIDPFGHSATQASLLSSPAAGFSAVFFARADYQDIAARQANRTTEMVWAPSPSLGNTAATYAGILHNGYGPPGGADMAEWSSDAPVMDDPTLEDYNVNTLIPSLVNAAISQAGVYPQPGTPTQDIMWTMGSDFNYENANTWFTNLDKIIHYGNLDGRANFFYSTPQDYATAKIASGAYTLKTDDFMPYGDGPNAIWSGYFVSRAALKGYVRDTSSVFQAAKLAQTLTGGATGTDPTNPLYRLERAMGVAQHHDAVAGTEKQAVAYDYARRLAWGRQDADGLFQTAMSTLTGTPGAAAGYNYYSCDLANVTICPALEAAVPTAVLLWNHQAQSQAAAPVLLPVAMPSGVTSWSVQDNTGKAVTAQLMPLSASDVHLRTQYYNYTGPTVQWLAWQMAVPAGGYAVYFLSPASSVEEAPETHISKEVRMRTGANLRGVGDQTVTNGIISLTVSAATGLISSFSNAQTGATAPLTQNLAFYHSSKGVPGGDGQASGAYIFRTNVTTAFPVTGGAVGVSVVTGPVINEVRQTYASWASAVVRLWAGATSADFVYDIGPIDISDNWGKEVVTTYNVGAASINNNGTWKTDSNGRDSILRLRNKRASWNYTVNQPIAGNYVPVNAFIYASDVTTGLTLNVAVDRSQGGASLADGELEVMLHRRILNDDGRGVGEPLNETGIDGKGLIIRTVHRVSLDTAATAGVQRRTALANLYYRPLPRISPLPTGVSPAQWIGQYKASYTGLTAALPANVHLLTAHSLGPKTLLLRVAHSYETGEDSTNSQPATVNLATIFAPFTITAATEMTLTGNQPLTAAPQVTYQVKNPSGGAPTTVTLPVVPPAPSGNGLQITLSPMQIRTFMCTTS